MPPNPPSFAGSQEKKWEPKFTPAQDLEKNTRMVTGDLETWRLQIRKLETRNQKTKQRHSEEQDKKPGIKT